MIVEQQKKSEPGLKFSILIPTWNNLAFLKLCVNSIEKNSTYKHQIIIHINEGIDGTLEWVKEAGLSYTYSKQNIGVCLALNAMRSIVDTDYILFMNDDMYVCPQWDYYLDEEIKQMPDKMFFLSSTLLQPRKFWCPSVISPVPLGQSVTEFEEEELLKHYTYLPHGDWAGSTWPPNIVHKDIWDLVGGYSIEYTPGMYSDPDFTAKLMMIGVRHFKGIDKSRVYHFEARTTARIKRNKGSKQFLFKWGITASSFMRHVLHRGKPFKNYEISKNRLKLALIKAFVKRFFLVFTGYGNVNKIWKW